MLEHLILDYIVKEWLRKSSEIYIFFQFQNSRLGKITTIFRFLKSRFLNFGSHTIVNGHQFLFYDNPLNESFILVHYSCCQDIPVDFQLQKSMFAGTKRLRIVNFSTIVVKILTSELQFSLRCTKRVVSRLNSTQISL